MKKRIMIEGMSCHHCEQRISTALNELHGISCLMVSSKKKQAVIEAEEKTTNQEIKEVIEKCGFTVKKIEIYRNFLFKS